MNSSISYEKERLLRRLKKLNLYKEYGFDLDNIIYLDDPGGGVEVILEIYVKRKYREEKI